MFEIRQFVPQARCLSCKICCRFSQDNSPWQPLVLKEETATFFEGGLPAESLLSSGRIKTLSSGRALVCLFFDLQNNRCKIYSRRPFECRLYPFLINQKKGHIYLAADANCPFITEQLNSVELKDYLEYLKGLLTRPDIFRMIKENRGMFMGYEGESIKNFFTLIKNETE